MATAKQNFYKWHRILGLTALIPVMMWTLSGLLHPFMSNWFRPTIAREVYKPGQIIKLTLTIKQVLDKNAISQFINFGLISFNKQAYYQVLGKDSITNYYSATNGTLVNDGDKQYATYLARYFTQDSTSKVKSITLQKTFDAHYQPINHLLPVWKIAFDRANGMDVYVETAQSRMGTFNNNTRKAMLSVFEQLHTWQFLEAIGGEQFRIVVLLVIVSIMFLSILTGLTVYGFFWKKFKTIKQNRKADKRPETRFVHRFHRQLGLIVSFVMFTFIISAAFHLIVKLHNIKPQGKSYSQMIETKELSFTNLQLPVDSIKTIGLIKYADSTYYQVADLKKNVSYFNTSSGKQLADGDAIYANYLSNFYRAGKPQIKVKGKSTITQTRQFDNEYGFINKRLPVQKVAYPNGENWYIETTTSQLATKVAGIDRAEGFSFIFLHKYFGMSWAGKNIRDIVSMLAALGVFVISGFGFAVFLKNK
ncbi:MULTISPECIES: PepSY domain-containing protein [unclassified Mucilaginibacter]|uniref:PepSY domain-containing protein n=1 Tax=unclassified Mucilaginibacter TaxID=2617802 RepID=UPI002AC90AA1|nr:MULTISPECIES: PepSY domain-containing protein [unclassified Mucilaginibacter]MEB0263102.1 PepSY domain-containing protein [Mucilaginibacter sp. 10I4]MEB0277762.1 PepSY domain-containing protein [Mucilaginibacter sp. 10B2]MEB0301916.1 PepSY domain-containing protein [Mucilaginibacter sp. 5C4]WPX24613.1 PepSY domain-containing protein [Mucilaginibacter sp. 5C4]